MQAKAGGPRELELLKGITGAFQPGVLTALMGASGAGKTTFMDVLAGRKNSEALLIIPLTPFLEQWRSLSHSCLL